MNSFSYVYWFLRSASIFLSWPLVINCKNLFNAFIFTGFEVIIWSPHFIIIFLISAIPEGNALSCSKCELQLSKNKKNCLFYHVWFCVLLTLITYTVLAKRSVEDFHGDMCIICYSCDPPGPSSKTSLLKIWNIFFSYEHLTFSCTFWSAWLTWVLLSFSGVLLEK